ncbi:hypothetical protein MJA45_01780 [Paenibacillus aurantius]|uniref:Uncharacterized protein n=1 Tax=Paenibacillus aurantius TaxID=2918900 RepID=A0AA96LDR7_9BACL|nr:hypothetical protein [Paenibacillus aurantius]WNQ11811.1 hypothetical protein MJA45_01780 [Paenibacillus aurantius]
MKPSIRKYQWFLRSKLPYVSIFMYITIVCALVLIISTYVLYYLFSKTMIREYGNQSANLLQKDAQSAEFLLDWTLSYALQTRNDPVILPFVQRNYENDCLNYEVWSRLKNLMDSHPFVDSIYLINGYNGNILDTRTGVSRQNQFYDSDIFEILKSRSTNMSQLIVPRELNTEHAPRRTRTKEHE